MSQAQRFVRTTKLASVDFREYPIEMALLLSDLVPVTCKRFTDILREQSSGPMDPEPDAFVTDVHAALMEQALDIAQT